MMKNRLLSILLVLALLLGFPAPIRAAGETYVAEASFLDCTSSYVLPYVTQYQKSAVLGGSTTLQFYAHVTNPDVVSLRILIYKPQQEQPVEQFELPIKHGCYYFTWTWNVPKSRYQVGSYQLITILDDRFHTSIHSFEEVYLNVVSSPVPATGIELAWNGYKADSGTLLLYTDRSKAWLSTVFQPKNSSSDRSVVYRSSDPRIVAVEQAAGYGYLVGKNPGTATVTATCGKLSASIPVTVRTVDSISIQKPSKTTFCPGECFHLLATSPGFSYISCSWKISDPEVVYMPPDMPETFYCGKPGTAVITANNGGRTDSVEITVRQHVPNHSVKRTEPTCTTDGLITGQCKYCHNNVEVVLPALGHQLSGDAVRTEPTATQPGALTGTCTVCQAADASVPIPPIFSDTSPNAWYALHVDKVYDLELMKGTDEHIFAPNRPVTRAMAATVLYRAAGEPAVAGRISFADVPLKSYYTKAVLWARENGVVNGYPDGTFRPNENITREQLAVILCRWAKAAGCDVSAGADLNAFPDGEEVHGYAKQALGWAVAEKLITGVGVDGTACLQPAGSATRAQFATIISRYLSTVEEAGETPDDPENPASVDPGMMINND